MSELQVHDLSLTRLADVPNYRRYPSQHASPPQPIPPPAPAANIGLGIGIAAGSPAPRAEGDDDDLEQHPDLIIVSASLGAFLAWVFLSFDREREWQPPCCE